MQYSAAITLQNIAWVRSQFLQPAGVYHCQLVTDDGVENFGVVTDHIETADSPRIDHLIAQRDIVFSNSMIEAANKQLKYRFLYHQHIPDHERLKAFVQQAVDDYNNRPHDRLHGLTPLEVLYGGKIDKESRSQEIRIAQQQRLIANKQQKCCFPTF